MKSRSGLYVVISALILASLSCNAVSSLAVPSSSSAVPVLPSSPVATELPPPVTAPELPPPPSIPSLTATDPPGQAAELAQRLADAGDNAERLAAWLAVYQALGIPVIAEDGASMTGTGDDPFGPPYWLVWYSSGMDQPERGILLSDAAKVLSVTRAGDYQENLGSVLLDDLRSAIQSPDATLQLLGLFINERVKAGASHQEILDPEAAPETLVIDLASVQLLSWAIMRDVVIAQPISRVPSSNLQLIALPGGSSDPMPAATSIRCSDIPMVDAITYMLSKGAGGTKIGDKAVGFKGWRERLFEAGGLSGDQLSQAKSFASGLNAVAKVLSLAAQINALEVELDYSGALERTQSTVHEGKELEVGFRLFYDPQKAEGDALWACEARLIGSVAGVSIKLPESKALEGAMLEIVPAKNIPEKVFLREAESPGLSLSTGFRFETGSEGWVRVTFVGQPQPIKIPDRAPSYDDEFSVSLRAQPEAVTGKSLATHFIDSVLNPGLPGLGGPGQIGPLTNVLKTLTYDLGEYEFALIDWGSTTYRASGGDKFEMSGTFCLKRPSTLSGGSGASFYFTPKGDTSGNVSYNRDAEGCTETGLGDYTVEWLGDDNSIGVVTWNASGYLTCPGLGAFSASGGESFQITAETEDLCSDH
jgi:hypothetical protein